MQFDAIRALAADTVLTLNDGISRTGLRPVENVDVSRWLDHSLRISGVLLANYLDNRSSLHARYTNRIGGVENDGPPAATVNEDRQRRRPVEGMRE
ncbi:hypothetical protein [Microbacterium galbinum]|uniref:hypothetical protein n=1 Tax=Microbacterium galbinum TaxID=2851646 RepID=UPI001FFCFC03|nr:hypothetical protein [Microbacterium galbinum]